MKSKLKGNLGVIKAIQLFNQEGYLVSLPFGDIGDYDLIVDIQGKLLKIQCKASETNNGEIVVFNTAVTSMFTRKKYTKNEVDYLFLYDILADKSFLVEPDGKTEITIRYSLPKNKQKNGIRLAEDYNFTKVLMNII